MVKIKADQLGNEIAKLLKEYTHEVEEGIEKSIKRVTTQGVTKLKNTSPKRTGKYAQGWGSKKTDDGRVIYNRTSGQLTHLLEKGHALRQGGRTRAIVHILPVEQEVIEKFEEEVVRVIQNG